MANHYRDAERLVGLSRAQSDDIAKGQVSAMLAVADRLARIAAALERLADGQEGPEPR